MARIVYLSWPAQEITGGIKTVFRHVEALQAAGFAAAVASPDGKSPTWFQTTVQVLKLADIQPDADVLVFPENHHGLLEQFAAWTNPKVVFCQNHFLVVWGLGKRSSYADFGVKELICPGQVAAAYCRRRFPGCRISIVPYHVDRDVFRPLVPKRLQIAFMPRKRPQEQAFIQDLFCAEQSAWRDIPWINIHGMPESQVARILGESAVYLSLCRFESFGLSLLEALACGCITAGFTGFGAREIATAANGFWAAEDDCVDAVDQLRRAVEVAFEGGSRFEDMLERGRHSVEQYSRERFTASLVKCWTVLAPAAMGVG